MIVLGLQECKNLQLVLYVRPTMPIYTASVNQRHQGGIVCKVCGVRRKHEHKDMTSQRFVPCPEPQKVEEKHWMQNCLVVIWCAIPAIDTAIATVNKYLPQRHAHFHLKS